MEDIDSYKEEAFQEVEADNVRGEGDRVGEIWEDVCELFDTPVNVEKLEKDSKDQQLDGVEPKKELQTQNSSSVEKESDWHQNSLGKLSLSSVTNSNLNSGPNLYFVNS